MGVCVFVSPFQSLRKTAPVSSIVSCEKCGNFQFTRFWNRSPLPFQILRLEEEPWEHTLTKRYPEVWALLPTVLLNPHLAWPGFVSHNNTNCLGVCNVHNHLQEIQVQNNSHKAMNIGYGKNTKGVKDELFFLCHNEDASIIFKKNKVFEGRICTC